MKTKELLSIVQKVIPATTKKGLVEGMDAITCNDGSITAYNDKISISYLSPLALENEKFSVNSSDLLQTLKTIKSDEVKLKIKNDDLLLISSDVQAKLAIKDSTTIDEMINALNLINLDFETLSSTFIEGLALCQSSCSTNVNDPTMLFCAAILKNTIFATDKYRLSMYKAKDLNMPNVLIPYTALPFIISFAPNGYTLEQGWIHFINEQDAILSCRIPNKEKAFDTFQHYMDTVTMYKYTTKIALPIELIEVLENMISFSDEDHNIDKVVTLVITKDQLKCSIDKKGGIISKYLPIKSSVIKATLYFNATFLREILSFINIAHIGKDCIKLTTKEFTHILTFANKNEA